MFVGSNAKKRTNVSNPALNSTGEEKVETTSSDLVLLEEWKKECSEQEGCQLIIDSHLTYITSSLQNPDLRIPALEILKLLTVEPSNRQTIASFPNLMDQIEKLRTGSLTQKQLADAIYERLLDAFLIGQAMDIGVSGKTDNSEVGTVVEKKPASSRQGKIVARPGKTQPNTETAANTSGNTEAPKSTSHTVNLFVENMDEKILSEIEACLLKTKGVISFFSDVEGGKVIVRLTSENIIDDVIGHIYETTKHRTSVIQGDYDSSGFPLYITQKKNEGGFFSSLYQIVSVSEVHTKDKKAGGGWLGSWW